MAGSTPPASNVPMLVQRVEKFTVIEFRTPSLMDPQELERIAAACYDLVDKEDRRQIILDFERVEFISSQAIGIVMNLHRKLKALPNSKLVVCGVGPRLMELIRITRLDRLLTIKPSQKEAIKVFV